jgi:hypothetical protein
MYKPSVKEQLDFFNANIKDFFQAFTSKNGQVIAVAIDSINNKVITIYFLNYNYDNELNWEDYKYSNLNKLVEYLNDDFSNYNQKLKIEFSELFSSGKSLGELFLYEFIFSFNQDVNIEQGDSEKFDLIFEDIKIYFGTSDAKVVTNDTQSKPEAFKSFIENTKKEIEQLIFLRSLQSPLDFEENIKLNQLLASDRKSVV